MVLMLRTFGMSGTEGTSLTGRRAEHPAKRVRLERVSELSRVLKGVELLATVHWVVEANHDSTEDEIIHHTHAWSDRKRQFSEHHIKLALKTLTGEGAKVFLETYYEFTRLGR